MIFYTAEQIANQYGFEISTLKDHFSRVQKSIYKKYGIMIDKMGRGEKTQYYIKDISLEDNNRAPTIFQSKEQNIIYPRTAASLDNLYLLTFIGIVVSPQRVFRGSYMSLLSYLELPISAQNIFEIKQVLAELEKRNLIMFAQDKTDSNYFMAGIVRRAEIEMAFDIKLLSYFKSLVENRKKSWIPIMKVYLAVNTLRQPCSTQQIARITGLSEYKIRDCLKILAQNNFISKRTIYEKEDEETFYCKGTQIDINAFKDNSYFLDK